MQDMDLTDETKRKLQEAIKVSDSLHNWYTTLQVWSH